MPDEQSLTVFFTFYQKVILGFLKSFVKTAVDLMFTKHGSMPVSALPILNRAAFPLSPKDYGNQLTGLLKYHCTQVCMKSTGKYCIPVFNILENARLSVILAHLKHTKTQKENKTDRKDAKWICDLFMCDMIRPSFISPANTRHLRNLVRYRFNLICMITVEKNRALNCLTVSNLKLNDVFIHVFGKSARSITEQILLHPDNFFDVAPFVDRRCKTPIKESQTTVDDAISPEQAFKLCQCLNHIDELEKHVDETAWEIFRISDKYKDALNLIQTPPGGNKNPMIAIQLLSEISSDMSVFPTTKHLVSWAGCCPRNDQSDRKIESTRTFRAGSYLKAVLLQIANALISSKKHPKLLSGTNVQKCAAAIRKPSSRSPYAPDRYLAHTFKSHSVYTGRFS